MEETERGSLCVLAATGTGTEGELSGAILFRVGVERDGVFDLDRCSCFAAFLKGLL